MRRLLAAAAALFSAPAAATSATSTDDASKHHRNDPRPEADGRGGGSGRGLALRVYNNTALVGPPVSSRIIPSFDFSVSSDHPFSAEAVGVLALDDDDKYRFDCDFGLAAVAFLFVDDHLVCQTGAYSEAPAVTGVDNPLGRLNKAELPVRLEVYYVPTPSEKEEEVVVLRTDYYAATGIESDSRQVEAKEERLLPTWSTTASMTVTTVDVSVSVVRVGASPSSSSGDAPVEDDVPTPLAPAKNLNPSPNLPEPELRRRSLQRDLARGWGLWNKNTLLDFVHLPSGVVVSVAICRVQLAVEDDDDIGVNAAAADAVLTNCTYVARPDGNARVHGALAYDFSYGKFSVSGGGDDGAEAWNASVRFSGGRDDGDLAVTFELLEEGEEGRGEAMQGVTAEGSKYALAIFGGSLWKRAAKVTAPTSNTLLLSPWGLPEMQFFAASSSTEDEGDHAADDGIASSSRTKSTTEQLIGRRRRLLLAANDDPRPHIVLPLAPGKRVGLSSAKRRTLPDIVASLDEKERAERERHEPFGDLAPVKEAVQAGVAWSVVYVPNEAGPIVPVSRGWGRAPARTPEWQYVTFDWDNIFASYMLSLDAKDLAYSNFIQVVKSKTADGFVPNYAAGTSKTSDRTEPPVGAVVLLEMYRKFGDGWLVELLFDDLLDWNDWFMSHRTLPPLNLIVLGGNGLQGARLESGLDNSPMYDLDADDAFDAERNLMLLYDVGMSSMVAAEAEALSILADAVARPEEVASALRARARSLRDGIAAHLWDGESGTFVNRLVKNGTFYRRVTPTSFYPMLAGIPSDGQVEEMMERYMFNSSRFCLSAKGDFAGNADGCYWGLPSVAADDPAYMKGSWLYWRGLVWGPMAQLVYWGLRRYDRVPSARRARKALCEQMTAMMMRQWRENRHICENFGPAKDTADCTGNKFYHWGGLAGFIALLEDGYYNASRAG